MAASMPFPFKTQIPATPPPDQQAFINGSAPSQPSKSFAQPAYGAFETKPQGNQQLPPKPSMPAHPMGPMGPDMAKLPDLAGDPRYLAMASRIASYYQQRCQAVTNFQQQRCQAWANMHRQKCQEMMSAAMLIVAWYIRDRISRRRRKQKRVFKRRLSAKSSRSKITKGESVRRWVMEVPLDATTPSASPAQEKLADQEEAQFSMDKDTAPDKDSHLFNIADNLIKSQLAKIDVPLLGTLSFDESESESEDEEIPDYDDEEEEEDEEEDDDDEYEEGYNMADDYVDDTHKGGKCYETIGSEEAQLGTGKGSGKHTASSVL
ncbi:hypothetical protein B0T17DRAFT_325181 [Bombardia bombarda]|uniref:Uncharacterized protein n=1 Tax=Bombardia bombarda TaxID=252184 RepID=A0AA39WML3_9PEZI|nr:hypothetical protein B0T17DRAFT_325181 [Bombardia bombarda]